MSKTQQGSGEPSKDADQDLTSTLHKLQVADEQEQKKEAEQNQSIIAEVLGSLQLKPVDGKVRVNARNKVHTLPPGMMEKKHHTSHPKWRSDQADRDSPARKLQGENNSKTTPAAQWGSQVLDEKDREKNRKDAMDRDG